jgi:hypothetical protein
VELLLLMRMCIMDEQRSTLHYTIYKKWSFVAGQWPRVSSFTRTHTQALQSRHRQSVAFSSILAGWLAWLNTHHSVILCFIIVVNLVVVASLFCFALHWRIVELWMRWGVWGSVQQQ